MSIDPYASSSSVPPRRPWYATDSGRAGLVLSLVTVAVLVVGVLVINGARRTDPTAAIPPGQEGATVLTRDPAPAPEKLIVVRGKEPEAKELPTPDREPVQTADRFGTTPPERR